MDQSSESTSSILVIGRREYVLENLCKLLEREGYSTLRMLEDQEDLLKRLFQKEYDLLVLGGGVDPHVQQSVTEAMADRKPEIQVLLHSGGPATLVPDVRKALA